MREIKFRHWDRNFMNYDPGHEPGDIGVTMINEWFEYEEKFNCIIMQYTGLKDKNDKEIYEGDICEFIVGCERDRYSEINNGLECSYVVIEYQNMSYGYQVVFPELSHEDDREWSSFWRDEEKTMWNNDYFSVIGNIHENPELLKEKKQCK